MNCSRSAAVFILLPVTLALPHLAAAHGFAGPRFFPATLATDDPFVADELSLPTVSTIEAAEGRETTISLEIANRITPNFAIELSQDFMDLNPKHEHEMSGFGNLELGAKYQFLRAPSMRQFSHSVQKLKSAGQASSEWTRIVSALGRPHFSLAKVLAICRKISRSCDPLR